MDSAFNTIPTLPLQQMTCDVTEYYIVAGRISYTGENTLSGKAHATSRVQTLMWESEYKPVYTIYVIFMYAFIHRGNKMK